MKLQTCDYLIIGQGVAGTLLTYFLLKANQKVLVLDEHRPDTASCVAAGVINPITGRRLVKSWMIDELLPFAKSTYQKMEGELNISVWKDQKVIRVINNVRQKNDWDARSAYPENYLYFDDTNNQELPDTLKTPFDYGILKGAAQVDLPLLVEKYRWVWSTEGILQNEKMEYDYLEIQSNGIQYKNIHAKKIVFCEGYQSNQNPWFNYVPIVSAKGEVLIIYSPLLKLKYLYKKQLMIVPLAEDHYWVGSNYEWDFENSQPTDEIKSSFLNILNQNIQVPFIVMDHKAAIRPTIKDRRPVLGYHFAHDNLAIFNGLGTKGASVGPFWAKKMTDFLLHCETLPKVVDVARFGGKKTTS